MSIFLLNTFYRSYDPFMVLSNLSFVRLIVSWYRIVIDYSVLSGPLWLANINNIIWYVQWSIYINFCTLNRLFWYQGPQNIFTHVLLPIQQRERSWIRVLGVSTLPLALPHHFNKRGGLGQWHQFNPATFYWGVCTKQTIVYLCIRGIDVVSFCDFHIWL